MTTRERHDHVRLPRAVRQVGARLGRRAPLTGSLARAFGHLVLRAAVGAALGVGLALSLLLIDAAIGWSLPLAADRVRDVVITLTGASLTIAVFALWMRSIVVSLVARVFHARTLSSFLDDRFQQAMAGWMVGAFSILVTVAVASPTTDEESVPPLATLLAFGTVVAALLGILLAVRHAVERLDTSDLLHQLADRGFRTLERTVALADDEAPEGPYEVARTIDARALGWVRGVDRPGLVRNLPEGATARLLVAPGSFVSPGQAVLTLDASVDEATADVLRGALEIGRTRDPESDLGSSIDELTDVAEHAAGPGADAATAREALRYLEALLGRLLERGLPSGHLVDEGRVLVATADPRVADHLGTAAERLRSTTDADPDLQRLVAEMFARLSARAEELGDQDTVEALRDPGPGRGSDGGRHPRALAHDEDRGPGPSDRPG